MTVAISAYRYFCIVCSPSFLQKKSKIFILPVLIFCILLNIPTFLFYELKYKETSSGETRITFKPTEVRNDPNVVYYYIFLAQNFARVFIPGIMLVFFNGNVIWKLYWHRKTITK